MRKLVSIFVKYPFYGKIIIFILLVGGIASTISMRLSFFPEFESRDINIMVAYPGASPKEMEEGITTRIEEAIRGIPGIREISSTSSENVATIQINTTGEYDLDETLMEVKNAVDGISGFPVDAERPVVYKVRSRSMAMFLGLSGDVDLLTLKNIAYQIEDDFLNSGIVSQVNLGGFPPVELSVEVSEENLLRYNITFDEIARAISLNNRDISAGQIKSDKEEILIRSRARSVDPNVISDIIIRANNDGSFLRIRDIGTVKMQFADVSFSSYMNGKESISIRIQKLMEEDLAEISRYVRDYVEEFNEKHESVKLEVTYDFLNNLHSRLNLLLKNGGIGLALVLITLGLFLSFRLSAWVAWGIPASFLAMFIIGNMYGITINMISLFGMILVIGILVDDGIVIAENIYSHFESGKSPAKAAVDGTMEVLPAVVTSILTTVVAFSPLIFVKQVRMQFMFEVAFVVIVSLLFSLFEAFLVLPGHVGNPKVLRQKRTIGFSGKIRRYLDILIDFMKMRFYGALLKRLITWRYIFVTVPVALIFITIGLFAGNIIKFTYFPSIPFDQFNVDLAFTPGTGEQITLSHLRRMEDSIWQVNEDLMEEYNDTSNFINYTFVSTGGAFNGSESGGHAGNIFVLLRDLEDAPVNSFEIVNRVRDKIGDIPEAEKFTVAGRNTFGNPISVSLLGKNLNELDAAKKYLVDGLMEIPEIQNITDNNALGKREIQLQLKPKAYFLGLDHASISNQVRQGFFGGQAQRLQHGKDELRVWVRYPKSDRISIGQLESMKIKTQRGEFPLIELADYSVERGPVNIQRYNGSREIRIDAEPVDPLTPIPPILEYINTQIVPEINTNFPGVRVEYQGQRRDSAESTSELSNLYGIAFFIMVLIVIIHFKSVWQGMIIILMIPIAWLGSVWGHGIEKLPVSMLSVWGMVALSGVIVNDAVVFLQKYNRFLLEGLTIKEAVYNAGLSRFRPIVLTSVTTVIGLYPIIWESSFQAQFLKPMAVALAYGVLFGTAFILIFFPVLILIVNDTKAFLKYLWTGKKVRDRKSLEEAIIYSKKKIE